MLLGTQSDSSPSSLLPGEFGAGEESGLRQQENIPKAYMTEDTVYVAEASYEMIPSTNKSGTFVLQSGGFKYIRNKKRNNIHYYGCMHKRYPYGCKGSGKLIIDSDVFYSYVKHICDKPLPGDGITLWH